MSLFGCVVMVWTVRTVEAGWWAGPARDSGSRYYLNKTGNICNTVHAAASSHSGSWHATNVEHAWLCVLIIITTSGNIGRSCYLRLIVGMSCREKLRVVLQQSRLGCNWRLIIWIQCALVLSSKSNTSSYFMSIVLADRIVHKISGSRDWEGVLLE